MESPVVGHVTVSCAPHPDHTTRVDHRVSIHADGSVTTPDHDNEPWAGSNHVEHTLGGNFTWTPCDWWREAGTADALGTTMWNGDRIHPMGSNPKSYLTPSTWHLSPNDAWTLPAQRTVWIALGLIPPPHAHQVPNTPALVVDPSTILPPEELLAGCLRIARHSRAADWRGGVPVTALSRVLTIDQGLTDDYLRRGVPWHAIEGFHSQGIQPATAARICDALASDDGMAVWAFGGPESFTANALTHIPNPERVAALLERYGPQPWLRQDLPQTRQYLRNVLPEKLHERLGEYVVAANTFERSVPRDAAARIVQNLIDRVDVDPTRWSDAQVVEHQGEMRADRF